NENHFVVCNKEGSSYVVNSTGTTFSESITNISISNVYFIPGSELPIVEAIDAFGNMQIFVLKEDTISSSLHVFEKINLDREVFLYGSTKSGDRLVFSFGDLHTLQKGIGKIVAGEDCHIVVE